MSNNTVFSGTEILELCDSIKDIQRVLRTVGEFFDELDGINDKNGNSFLDDFKKWGIKTVTSAMLEKQFRAIEQLSEIYTKEEKSMKG